MPRNSARYQNIWGLPPASTTLQLLFRLPAAGRNCTCCTHSLAPAHHNPCTALSTPRTAAGGNRSLPAAADLQKCIARIHEELKGAGAGGTRLAALAAAGVGSVLRLLAEKAEQMAATGEGCLHGEQGRGVACSAHVRPGCFEQPCPVVKSHPQPLRPSCAAW